MARMTREEFGSVMVSALEKMNMRPQTEEEIEKEVQAECLKMWKEEQALSEKAQPSLKAIPKFFSQRDAAPNGLKEQVRREARIRMLKEQETLLLDQEELEACHAALLRHATPASSSSAAAAANTPGSGSSGGGGGGGQERINWDGFCQARASLPWKVGGVYLTASLFCRFNRDAQGAIPVLPFYQFVVCRDALLRKRITLGWYDFSGAGSLREQDLDNFVQDEIHNSPLLATLEKSFQTFYVCTAVRMLLFFLDATRRGKVKIKDLIKGPMLDELLALRHCPAPSPHDDPDAPASSSSSSAAAAAAAAALQGNWFAPASAKRVYGLYLHLDSDGNGMLSQKELLRYEGAYLTQVFVARVFEEAQTYEGEMDFKSFLDFVLAMENRSSLPALQYLWRVLDMHHRGSLGVFEINFFFKSVRQALIDTGHAAVETADVIDEIFDMVRPKDPERITLQDLINSNVGETVVSILIDMQAFYQYDNRESLIAQHAAEDQS